MEYKGRRTTWKEVKDQNYNDYIFYINRNKVVDAYPYKKALGRFANDARGLTRINGLKNNSEYIIDGDKVYIEAKRSIRAGAEILVDYGQNYWKVMRENLKEKEAEEKDKKSSGKKKKKKARKKS